MTIPEHLIAVLDPLKWVVYAYVSDREDLSVRTAGMLGITRISAVEAWDRYTADTDSAYAAMKNEGSLPFMCFHRAFNPDAFICFMVSMALAAELLPEFRAVLDMLGGLTPDLAVRLFSSSREEAVGWRIAVSGQKHLTRLLFDAFGMDVPLHLRCAVKNFLLGVAIPPEHCEIWYPDALPEPLVACDIPQLIDAGLKVKPLGNIFVISGAKGAGRKYQFLSFLKLYGSAALVIRYDDISDDMTVLSELETLIALSGYFLCIRDLPENAPKFRDLLRKIHPANVFVITESERTEPIEGFQTMPLPVPVLSRPERAGLWRMCLGGEPFPEDPERLAAQYQFTIGQIISSCEMARDSAALHEACRRQLSHSLDKTASRVKTGCSWDDIVLPCAQKRLLRHICDCVRLSGTVYDKWGIDPNAVYGRGVRALFSGPPGTGKTMAARVIAKELEMELFKIDLSSLVSKYIGDTEKNLDAVFTEAEKSGGILFFDEADAIFGRRGEQKDSHDKYANMQTAFLLQRFEDYDGVILLATNLISNLDPAFMRRIQVRVEFPQPGRSQRRILWECMLNGSGNTPLDTDIDIEFLAEKFELTGSDIRNITLTSAFLAASERGVIGMGEIIRALAMEYGKTDKILAKSELGEYAEYGIFC